MEQKTKFSFESDFEKGLDTLAEVKAYCTYCRNTGICKPDDCSTCPKQKWFLESVRTLIPIDLLKIDMMSVEKLKRYLEVSAPEKRNREARKRYYIEGLKMILILVTALMIAPFLLTLFFMRVAGDYPPPLGGWEKRYQKPYVERVLKTVHEEIYDMNRDGKINCQDYAVLFKWVWDRDIGLDFEVEITHNLNFRTGMNHLFITLQCEGGTYYIEPQRNYNEEYLMERVWGSAFDYRCNVYAERNWWYKRMGLI